MTVPALREGVAVRRYGKRIVAEDAVRRVRVPIDALSVAVLQALADGAATPTALCKAVGAKRSEVWRRVVLLNKHLLLATSRASDQVALARRTSNETWPADKIAEAPLRYPDGLAHGCVACGACCAGTDIGPLKADDIERLEEIDWSPHLPDDVSRADWLQRIDYQGQEITLLGHREGRCVFLGPDKLCVVHTVAGAAHKPTICRQFPYTFTRTPDGIDVSFAMECRSWYTARRRGKPVDTDEAAIRALLTESAPVLDLPLPVPVWDGLDWDLASWRRVRAVMLAAAREAESVDALVAGVVAAALTELDANMAGYAAGEDFLIRDGWGLPEVEATVGGEGVNFMERCRVVSDSVHAGIDDLRQRCLQYGDRAQAGRLARLDVALASVLAGERLVDLVPFEGDLRVWKDVVMAALYAHEPVRRSDLLTGLSLLILRVIAGRQLAALTARDAMRVRTSEQDVVDSMVLLTKMLRGAAVEAILRPLRVQFVELFVLNASVFTRGTAPQAVAGRLPGDA